MFSYPLHSVLDRGVSELWQDFVCSLAHIPDQLAPDPTDLT